MERGLTNIPARLNLDDLTDIVREPARAVRLRFEDGLAEAIVDDALRSSAVGQGLKAVTFDAVTGPIQDGAAVPMSSRAGGRQLNDDTRRRVTADPGVRSGSDDQKAGPLILGSGL
ncbi:hypothetical protein [Microbispora sp. NPDC049125]|uniref:hypothetical protein n=1 Tax=Microbispora sp. NPDC049125 TaxID=3154929 RepID=UPI00346582A3